MTNEISKMPCIQLSKENLKLMKDLLTEGEAGQMMLDIYDYVYVSGEEPDYSDSKILKGVWNNVIDFVLKGKDKYNECIKNSPKNNTTDRKTYYHQSLARAKELKKNQTKAELLFGKWLKENHIKSSKQKMIKGSDGTFYFADFVVFGNIIIEIDGEYHNNEEQKEKDKKRTNALEAKGYKVIRFTNEEVFKGISLEYFEKLILEVSKPYNTKNTGKADDIPF